MFDLNLVKPTPTINSLDPLKGLDGLGSGRIKEGYFNRVLKLGIYFTKSGYERQLSVATDKLQEKFSNFRIIRQLAIKNAKKHNYPILQKVDWEGNLIEEKTVGIEEKTKNKNLDIKKCKDKEIDKFKNLASPFAEKYIGLAMAVSNKSLLVEQEIARFFNSPCDYLYEIDHDKPKAMNEELIVYILINILEKHNFVLWIDWKESLEQYVYDGNLQELCGAGLASKKCINDIITAYENDSGEHSVDEHFKLKETFLVKCIQKEGYTLFRIKNSSEMNAIGLIRLGDVKILEKYPDVVDIIDPE